MAKIYTYAEASAEVKAKLESVRGSLYRFPSRGECLFKEIDPTKPIEQFGGVLSIRKFSSGAIQIFGLAGKSLLKNMDAMFGKLLVTYTAQVITSAAIESPGGGTYGTGSVKGQSATSVAFVADEGYNAEDCIEELILGWIMPAEYGTIYHGKWQVTSNHNHYGTVHNTAGPNMAIMTRIPIEIDWAQVDLASARTNYLEGSGDFESEVSAEWDAKFGSLETKFNFPIVIGSTTAKKEVGMTFLPIVKTRGMSGIAFSDMFVGNAGDQYADKAAAEAAGKSIAPYSTIAHAAAGRLISGMIVPRLDGGTTDIENYSVLNNVSEDYFRNACVNPPYDHACAQWPEIAGDKPARQVFGHLLPGIYASDSDMTKSGTVLLQDSFQPSNSSNYGFAVISTIDPADENDTGEVNLEEMSDFQYARTNLESFGGNLYDYLDAIIQEIEEKVEADARAGS